MLQYILCGIYLLFTVSGLTFMKMGSIADNLAGITIPIINLRMTLLSLVGYGCYIVSFLVYTVVISKYDLGVIVPILGGIVNVLVLLVAYFILKEQFTINAVIGAVLIIIGIVIMNIK